MYFFSEKKHFSKNYRCQFLLDYFVFRVNYFLKAPMEQPKRNLKVVVSNIYLSCLLALFFMKKGWQFPIDTIQPK